MLYFFCNAHCGKEHDPALLQKAGTPWNTRGCPRLVCVFLLARSVYEASVASRIANVPCFGRPETRSCVCVCEWSWMLYLLLLSYWVTLVPNPNPPYYQHLSRVFVICHTRHSGFFRLLALPILLLFLLLLLLVVVPLYWVAQCWLNRSRVLGTSQQRARIAHSHQALYSARHFGLIHGHRDCSISL